MNDTDEQNRPQWRAVDPASMVWASWDADHAVYHRPSGRTHFVNETSRRLIAEILPDIGSAGADTITAALDLPPEAGDVSDEIGDLLRYLEALGLIERA